jgi:hypothetical protein
MWSARRKSCGGLVAMVAVVGEGWIQAEVWYGGDAPGREGANGGSEGGTGE